jgi:hypothetical protein
MQKKSHLFDEFQISISDCHLPSLFQEFKTKISFKGLKNSSPNSARINSSAFTEPIDPTTADSKMQNQSMQHFDD